jgi:hypothetical protein
MDRRIAFLSPYASGQVFSVARGGLSSGSPDKIVAICIDEDVGEMDIATIKRENIESVYRRHEH